MIELEDIKKYREYAKYSNELYNMFLKKRLSLEKREELRKLKKMYDEIKNKNEELKYALNAWNCGNSWYTGKPQYSKNPWTKQFNNNKKRMKEIKNEIYRIDETDRRVKRMYNDEENYILHVNSYQLLLDKYFNKINNNTSEIIKETNEIYKLTKKNKSFKKTINNMNLEAIKEQKKEYKKIVRLLNEHCNTPNLRNTDKYLYYEYYDKLMTIRARTRTFCEKIINSNKYIEFE